MGMVKNLPAVTRGLDTWVARVRHTHIEDYRAIVWTLFLRIVNQTPQSSGLAVANWNLGIDAPDYTMYVTKGDDPIDIGTETYKGGPQQGLLKPKLVGAHEKGDRKFIQRAHRRNRPKLALIGLNTRVYITNAALGDNDNGRSSELYVESFQDPAYWLSKLREVNQPYETVRESVAFLKEQMFRRKGRRFSVGGDKTDRYD